MLNKDEKLIRAWSLIICMIAIVLCFVTGNKLFTIFIGLGLIAYLYLNDIELEREYEEDDE